jgi:hypothetical protein
MRVCFELKRNDIVPAKKELYEILRENLEWRVELKLASWTPGFLKPYVRGAFVEADA